MCAQVICTISQNIYSLTSFSPIPGSCFAPGSAFRSWSKPSFSSPASLWRFGEARIVTASGIRNAFPFPFAPELQMLSIDSNHSSSPNVFLPHVYFFRVSNFEECFLFLPSVLTSGCNIVHSFISPSSAPAL